MSDAVDAMPASEAPPRAAQLETFLAPLRAPSSVPVGACFYMRGNGWVRCVAAPADGERKVRVQFEEGKLGGNTSNADVSKLIPVLRSCRSDVNGKALLLCEETTPFRAVARSQVSSEDRIVELGCSFGEMTALLLERTANVVAVDHVSGVLEAASRRAPGALFEMLDALAHPASLLALCRSFRPTVLFIDLGGDRPAADITPLLARLLPELHTVALLVVKCRALARAARTRGGAGAVRTNGSGSAAHPCVSPLPHASAFWSTQLRRAVLAATPSSARTVQHGAGVLDEQNAKCAPGETRLCFEFTNQGRCRRRNRCSFRHVLREHPDAVADAALRGRALTSASNSGA